MAHNYATWGIINVDTIFVYVRVYAWLTLMKWFAWLSIIYSIDFQSNTVNEKKEGSSEILHTLVHGKSFWTEFRCCVCVSVV